MRERTKELVTPTEPPPRSPKPIGKIEVMDLIKAGLINPNDKIYRIYNGEKHKAEILRDGKIRLEYDGTVVNSLSKATGRISKKSENGWIIWKYIDRSGKEWLMSELRDMVFPNSHKNSY